MAKGLKFSEKAHRYWLDGKPCTGVTTLLKGVPKPALVHWAAKSVAEHVARNEDLVNSLRQHGERQMIAALKEVPWEQRDAAALRGTEVHDLAERVIHGEAVDAGEHVGLVQGYVDWLDEHDVEPVLVERSCANRTNWYAGRFDLIAKVDGETWMLDVKTSKGVYGEYALQLAAYAHAEFYTDDENNEHPMPKIDRYGALHVTEGVTSMHEVPADKNERAWELFLLARDMYRAQKEIDSMFEGERL